ncbi:MAG: ion channel [Planctomycetota bacterium]
MQSARTPVKKFAHLGAHTLLLMLAIEFFAAPIVLSDGSPVWLILLHAGYQIIIFMFLIGLAAHPVLVGSCATLVAIGSAVRLFFDSGDQFAGSAANATGAAAVLIVIVMAMRRFFTLTKATPSTISAALALYLLSGLFWSLVYAGLEASLPGSFVNTAGPLRADDLHYFSYVTMTTLGYGDIVPTHPIARSCALTQALLGQVFIAVVIGRLVALHVAHRTDK